MKYKYVAAFVFVSSLGACEPTREDCEEQCHASGYCEPHGWGEDGYAICEVGSDADCKLSDDCELQGLCAKDGDHCTVTKESCSSSPSCTTIGVCSVATSNNENGLWCAATSAGCAHSTGCSEQGNCKVVNSGDGYASRCVLDPDAPHDSPGTCKAWCTEGVEVDDACSECAAAAVTGYVTGWTCKLELAACAADDKVGATCEGCAGAGNAPLCEGDSETLMNALSTCLCEACG